MVWSKASSLTTGIFFILFLLIVGSQKVSSALGESCSTFSNCTGLGEVCIPSTNVCGCSADYYQANSDSCQMKLAYAEACDPATQPGDVCLEANTACIESVSGGSYCLCTALYYRSADDTTCSHLDNLKVSNIVALHRTTTTVTLVWSANTSGTNVSYNIQTSEGATMSAITGTTATVTGLTPGTQYTFFITTVLPADGYNPWKSVMSTSPAVWTVPAKPGAVTNVQLVSEQPVVVYEITFTPSQGQISHYTVTVNNETVQTLGSVTTVTFTSLQLGQSYTYSITSYNGRNDPSEPFNGTFNTPIIGPGPVSQLAINGISATGAKVKWEKPDRPNGDITGYTLTVTEGSTCVFGHINTCLDCATPGVSGNISHCQTTVTEGNSRASLNDDDTIYSVVLSDLEPLHNYTVSVTADDTEGTGESNHVAFRTLAQGLTGEPFCPDCS